MDSESADRDQQLIQRDILAYLAAHEQKELLRLVTVGSVDDGKSTLIGRLLYDAGGVYEDQLEAVRKASSMEGTDIDLSLVTDGLNFPLLSDFWPHGEVAGAYDVFDEGRGCARRSSYIVDKAGSVRWAVHNAMPDGRDLDEHLEQLRALA